jgi:hypothetical protein
MTKTKPDFANMPADEFAEAMGNVMTDMVAPIVERVIRHRMKLISAEIIKNMASRRL